MMGTLCGLKLNMSEFFVFASPADALDRAWMVVDKMTQRLI